MYRKGIIVGTYDFVTRADEDLCKFASERAEKIVLVVVASYNCVPDLGTRMLLSRRALDEHIDDRMTIPPITDAQFEPPDTYESRIAQYGRYIKTYMDRPRNILTGVDCLFTLEEHEIGMARAMRIDAQVMPHTRPRVPNSEIRDEIMRAGSIVAMDKYHHHLHPETVKIYGAANPYADKRTYIYAGVDDADY